MNTPWVDKLLNTMSLEEKVGQLLIIGFYNLNEQTYPEIKDKIIQYHIGGFHHFNAGHEFLAGVFEGIQKHLKIPMLVSADYELGTGWNIREGTNFPRSMARGYTGDPDTEYEIARHIAIEGRSIGANITFSPVIDVNTFHLCPDVNVRSYGDDPDKISALCVGYIKGIQENGMLATAKHFPGNGGTNMDQHISPAIINYSRQQMYDIFLKPYRKAIDEANVAAIMVAHLEVPALCTELNPANGRPVPASASYEIITELLKEELGFKGLVITDALNMGGITNHYPREEAIIRALTAGNDVILEFYPADFEKDYNAILKAVEQGKLAESRINDAVRNILTAKAKLGLDKDHGKPKSKPERDRIFLSEKGADLAKTVAQKAITLVRNRGDVLPIKNISGKKVCVFNVFSPENEVLISQGQFPMPEIITSRLKERGALVDAYEVVSAWNQTQTGELAQATQKYDYTFLNFFIIPNYAVGTLAPNRNGMRLFSNGLITLANNLVITAFGDPYVFFYCQTAPVYMCTFDESRHSQEMAVKAWLGEIPITGKMPVEFDGFFKRGDGLCL